MRAHRYSAYPPPSPGPAHDMVLPFPLQLTQQDNLSQAAHGWTWPGHSWMRFLLRWSYIVSRWGRELTPAGYIWGETQGAGVIWKMLLSWIKFWKDWATAIKQRDTTIDRHRRTKRTQAKVGLTKSDHEDKVLTVLKHWVNSRVKSCPKLGSF